MQVVASVLGGNDLVRCRETLQSLRGKLHAAQESPPFDPRLRPAPRRAARSARARPGRRVRGWPARAGSARPWGRGGGPGGLSPGGRRAGSPPALLRGRGLPFAASGGGGRGGRGRGEGVGGTPGW